LPQTVLASFECCHVARIGPSVNGLGLGSYGFATEIVRRDSFEVMREQRGLRREQRPGETAVARGVDAAGRQL
jgi:hypothetical protein